MTKVAPPSDTSGDETQRQRASAPGDHRNVEKAPAPSEDLERKLALAQVQPLLTKARTLLRRLDFHAAMELCEESLRSVPDCAFAFEMKGDVHRALGEHDSALEAYRKAVELEPGNRRVEEKYALVAVEMDEARLLGERRQEAFADPQRFLKGQKNPVLSCLASCLFPGFGQIYNEEFLKGSIVLAVFLFSSYFTLSALWLMLESIKVSSHLWMAPKAFESMGMGRLLWYLVSSLLTLGVYSYSIVDAPLTTLRGNNRRLAELGIEKKDVRSGLGLGGSATAVQEQKRLLAELGIDEKEAANRLGSRASATTGDESKRPPEDKGREREDVKGRKG